MGSTLKTLDMHELKKIPGFQKILSPLKDVVPNLENIEGPRIFSKYSRVLSPLKDEF